MRILGGSYVPHKSGGDVDPLSGNLHSEFAIFRDISQDCGLIGTFAEGGKEKSGTIPHLRKIC